MGLRLRGPERNKNDRKRLLASKWTPSADTNCFNEDHDQIFREPVKTILRAPKAWSTLVRWKRNLLGFWEASCEMFRPSWKIFEGNRLTIWFITLQDWQENSMSSNITADQHFYSFGSPRLFNKSEITTEHFPKACNSLAPWHVKWRPRLSRYEASGLSGTFNFYLFTFECRWTWTSSLRWRSVVWRSSGFNSVSFCGPLYRCWGGRRAIFSGIYGSSWTPLNKAECQSCFHGALLCWWGRDTANPLGGLSRHLQWLSPRTNSDKYLGKKLADFYVVLWCRSGWIWVSPTASPANGLYRR